MMWRAAKLYSVLVVCQAFVFIHAQDGISGYVKNIDHDKYHIHLEFWKCVQISIYVYPDDSIEHDQSIFRECKDCCTNIKASLFNDRNHQCNCLEPAFIKKGHKTTASDLEMTDEKFKKFKQKIYDMRRADNNRATSKRAGPSNQIQDNEFLSSDLDGTYSQQSQENKSTGLFSKYKTYGRLSVPEFSVHQQDPPETPVNLIEQYPEHEGVRLKIEDSAQRDNNNMSPEQPDSPIQMLDNRDHISQFFIGSQQSYTS